MLLARCLLLQLWIAVCGDATEVLIGLKLLTCLQLTKGALLCFAVFELSQQDGTKVKYISLESHN